MENFLRLVERWMAEALSHEWAWRILIGLFVLVIGSWLARALSRILDRLMHRFAVEAILRNFLRNLAYAVFLVIIIVAALDFAGPECIAPGQVRRAQFADARQMPAAAAPRQHAQGGCRCRATPQRQRRLLLAVCAARQCIVTPP